MTAEKKHSATTSVPDSAFICNKTPVEEMDTLLSDAKGLIKQCTNGKWCKGSTSHETVAVTNDGNKPYHVAMFRHANDAAFIDFCHAYMERFITEIENLRMENKKLSEGKK